MNTKAPTFSLVIPVFNRSHLLQRALKSCSNQIFRDFEIVVVDDGSIESIKSVTDQFAHQSFPLNLVTHQKNAGLNQARASGIAASKGKWVILFDSDDELFPECLETIAEQIEKDRGQHDLYGFPWELADKSWNNIVQAIELDSKENFLKWASSKDRPSDLLCCLRLEALKAQPYPNWHKSEFFFFLNFSHSFRILYIYGKAVGKVHYDAVDSLSRSSRKLWARPKPSEIAAVPIILKELRQNKNLLERFALNDYFAWARYCLRISVLNFNITNSFLSLQALLKIMVLKRARQASLS